METDVITSVSLDRASPWRAHYVWMEDGEVQHRADVVVGWAAVGLDLWPVRVSPTNGHGLLVGGATEDDRDRLVSVLAAGTSWEGESGMDDYVRRLIAADMESRGEAGDAEADED